MICSPNDFFVRYICALCVCECIIVTNWNRMNSSSVLPNQERSVALSLCYLIKNTFYLPWLWLLLLLLLMMTLMMSARWFYGLVLWKTEDKMPSQTIAIVVLRLTLMLFMRLHTFHHTPSASACFRTHFFSWQFSAVLRFSLLFLSLCHSELTLEPPVWCWPIVVAGFGTSSEQHLQVTVLLSSLDCCCRRCC